MTRPDVLLSHRFPPENAGGIEAFARELRDRLPATRVEVASDYGDALQRIPDAEVVVEHAIDDDLLAAAENLAWLQSLSSGHDRFDTAGLADDGVILTTVSGVHADPVAQHVLGYLLTFERGLRRADRQQRRREWRRFAPGDLSSRTVAVVGVGAIGTRVAELLESVNCEVVGVKRDLDEVPDPVDRVHSPDELHAALGAADYAVACCPLTEETCGLFDSRAFASLGPGGVFVNVARGEVADEAALVDALRTGMLRGAALDVVSEEPLPRDSPLWDHENVLLTPHMAGGSPRFAERCAEIVAENYERYVDGDRDRMRNRVV